MALLADPGRRSERFSLGYSYGEETKTWAIAFTRYCEIDNESDLYSGSLNNRGVLLQDLDKASSVEYYERGMAGGNALAKSNLARLLIHDGYYAVAERLLGDITDPQDGEEHIANSRAAALAGRRAMSKRLEEIRAFAEDETRRYNGVVARSLRALDRRDAIPRGVYASEDQAFFVLFDAAGAAFRVTVGTLTFEGVIPYDLLGYSGMLTAKGQGLLGSVMNVSAVVTGQNEVAAIVWPNKQSTMDRIRVVELRRFEPSPNPTLGPPPIVQQITK